MTGTIGLLGAILLDLIFGDPSWIPHPVCMIGNLISAAEKKLWSTDQKKNRIRGSILVIFVLILSTGIPAAILWLVRRLPYGNVISFCLSVFWSFQLLAARGLYQESRRVELALLHGSLEESRTAVGRIVGRDTGQLTRDGVTRAAVETVAENTSDGVIAPLLFLAVFWCAWRIFLQSSKHHGFHDRIQKPAISGIWPDCGETGGSL